MVDDNILNPNYQLLVYQVYFTSGLILTSPTDLNMLPLTEQNQGYDLGVTQGFLMCFRLFEIYVNDIPDSSRAGFIYIFADESTIYYNGRDIQEILDPQNTILKDNKE